MRAWNFIDNLFTPFGEKLKNYALCVQAKNARGDIIRKKATRLKIVWIMADNYGNGGSEWTILYAYPWPSSRVLTISIH